MTFFIDVMNSDMLRCCESSRFTVAYVVMHLSALGPVCTIIKIKRRRIRNDKKVLQTFEWSAWDPIGSVVDPLRFTDPANELAADVLCPPEIFMAGTEVDSL